MEGGSVVGDCPVGEVTADFALRFRVVIIHSGIFSVEVGNPGQSAGIESGPFLGLKGCQVLVQPMGTKTVMTQTRGNGRSPGVSLLSPVER